MGYLIPVCVIAFVGSGRLEPLSLLGFLSSCAYDGLEDVRL